MVASFQSLRIYYRGWSNYVSQKICSTRNLNYQASFLMLLRVMATQEMVWQVSFKKWVNLELGDLQECHERLSTLQYPTKEGHIMSTWCQTRKCIITPSTSIIYFKFLDKLKHKPLVSDPKTSLKVTNHNSIPQISNVPCKKLFKQRWTILKRNKWT